ncbi:MAG: 50S ribosomal protein L9 [bacterium]|nr:50S ribosomal protein L9 [bacterium]
MKVILREDVDTVGLAGETVEVKDGYGRNFLIPRNLAIPATQGNVKAIDEVRKQRDIRVKKRRKAAEVIKDRIERVQLRIAVMVGEEDRLFGSVTNNDVAKLLETEGISVDKRAIDLEEPIKALGMYAVPVKLEKDVVAHAKLLVEKKIA